MEGYIAQICLFAGNFAPRGWAFCQGQILSIAQNTALFALLGTTYGGNGQTTFAPARPARPGPGGHRAGAGAASGPTWVRWPARRPTRCIQTEMPIHNHARPAARRERGVQQEPQRQGRRVSRPAAPATPTRRRPTSRWRPPTVGIAGGSQPFSIMQPYLGMNYIICLEGVFPSRN